MIASKSYKVARVLRPVGGQSRYLAVSEDGDCWSIRRPTNLFTTLTDGASIEVPLVKRPTCRRGEWLYTPLWSAVGWTAHRVTILPFVHSMVLKVWGDRAASAFKQVEFPEDRDLPVHTVVVPEEYFTTCRQMSAAAKAEAAQRICKFMASGFRRDLCDITLQQLLCRLFWMNPAENHRFVNRWFSTTRSKIAFLRRIQKMTPAGDPSASLSDLQRFIRNWMVLHVWHRWAATERRAGAVDERATLLVLLKRHGIPPQFWLPPS